MKIIVVGTRGFPGVQGGVERHCEKLYTHLAEKGCDITVFTRKSYVTPDLLEYKGVTLLSLNCPKNKFLEAFVHTFKGVLKARHLKPDILHIHAIGPSFFTPFVKVMGMKVVITHHGPDYKRKKWPLPAKMFLKFSERIGVTFADKIIAISDNIADDIKRKYHRMATVIPNGVDISAPTNTDFTLKKFGLQRKKYILAVGRFVPEKGFHDLIEAFNKLQVETAEKVPNPSFPDVIGESNIIKNQRPLDSRFRGNDTKTRLFQDSQVASYRSQIEGWKLVIVGDADHDDKYSRDLKIKASRNKDIILTGFLTGQPLQELYSHAGLFVLSSYYEGLPIVLLEAMSYELSCIASDIPANRNVELAKERFFKLGDVNLLAEKIKEFINKPWGEEDRIKQINSISVKYNWQRIADETLKVYKNVTA